MDKEPCGYFMVRVRNFAPPKNFFFQGESGVIFGNQVS